MKWLGGRTTCHTDHCHCPSTRSVSLYRNGHYVGTYGFCRFHAHAYIQAEHGPGFHFLTAVIQPNGRHQTLFAD